MKAGAVTAGIDPESDERYMALALELGRRGLGRTWPNPSVGAVLVRRDADGTVIVGRGWTAPAGRPHAETQALERAGSSARGATLYVTLEPCSHYGQTPPCADAIVAAGVAEVVSALEDPNPQVSGRGHRGLAAAGVAVRIGVGAAAAQRDHAGHIRRMREGRPNVTLKLAVSADGKVARAGRRPVAITREPARQHVHRMRAASDAVMTGIGTVLSDDPLLTCRLPGMADRSPLRVVLDSTLRLGRDTRLVATTREAPVWVVTIVGAPKERGQALQEQGIRVLEVPGGTGGLDLVATLRCLGELGITRLMVEAGPILTSGLLGADLVDEVVLLHGPGTIGADGIDALEGQPLTALTQSPRFQLMSTESLGTDTIEVLVHR